jgi:hypothetical protein
VKSLTDEVGILQHSKYSMPNRKEGYTTDDNARALIACTNYLNLFNDSSVTKLVQTYLSLLFYMQRSDGKMHNFLSYDRVFLDEVGSEDSMGRTLWASGYCLSSKLTEETKLASKEIFDSVFKWASRFSSPRAKAYAIMGLFYYQKAYPEDKNVQLEIRLLADQLCNQFKIESSEGWYWFESYLTYSNARLPHSLFLAFESTRNKLYLQVALESMNFLIRNQTINETFVPIGNKGWFRKGSDRALYDQQSIEASCTTEAALSAFKITRKVVYREAAFNAFSWFFGKNLQGVILYNEEEGSCCDGITPEGLNLNKGAESNIGYLQARLSLDEIKKTDMK